MPEAAPRPGEQSGVDYHFRTREQVEALRREARYVVLDVRGDLQALDFDDLSAVLQGGDALFEGNPFFGRLLQTHAALEGVRRLGIFISPLSKEEIAFLRGEPQVSLPDLVRDVMRRKLLRRTRRQKGEPSLKDLEDIERRAGSAYAELAEAHHFDHVIPNHDGEDSDDWDAFYYLACPACARRAHPRPKPGATNHPSKPARGARRPRAPRTAGRPRGTRSRPHGRKAARPRPHPRRRGAPPQARGRAAAPRAR